MAECNSRLGADASLGLTNESVDQILVRQATIDYLYDLTFGFFRWVVHGEGITGSNAISSHLDSIIHTLLDGLFHCLNIAIGKRAKGFDHTLLGFDLTLNIEQRLLASQLSTAETNLANGAEMFL